MNYEEVAKNAVEQNTMSALSNDGIQVTLMYSIACSLISISNRLGQLQVELNEFNRMHKKI